MAFCEYASHVGGKIGPSAENPASSQCVTISNCNKDISGHLRTFMSGFADSSITTEAELLLARAGRYYYLSFSLKHFITLSYLISIRDRAGGGAGGGGALAPHFFGAKRKKKKERKQREVNKRKNLFQIYHK